MTAEDNDLDDIASFLEDKRPEVKMAALGIVLGLTGSPEGLDRLKSRLSKLLPILLRLVTDSSPRASEQALGCLVNVLADPSAVPPMLALNAVGRMMDYLREGTVSSPKLLVMLLCNLTTTDEGCGKLLQLGQGKLEGLHMAVLLKKFVSSGVTLQPGEEDPFEHVAGIITNVTRLRQGRELLLQPGRGLLQVLASQLRSPSALRRQGVAGAIRNCCMTAEADGTLESIVSDAHVLSFLLKPLDGQAPKEADDTVRENLADSILSLASTESGRKALWEVNGPEILRKGYEFEEHPGVCRSMEHAAEQFLTAGRVEDNLSMEGLSLKGEAPPNKEPIDADYVIVAEGAALEEEEKASAASKGEQQQLPASAASKGEQQQLPASP